MEGKKGGAKKKRTKSKLIPKVIECNWGKLRRIRKRGKWTLYEAPLTFHIEYALTEKRRQKPANKGKRK